MIGSEEEARSYIAEGWGSAAVEDCARLIEALRRENERQNLVSRGSLDHVWVRHIADSAQLLHHAPAACRSWVDIGSGAGLPGLVIGLLRRDLALTLVELRRLRVAWLEAMRDALKLNCRIEMAKAEALPPARHDVISARAVAELTTLLRITENMGDRNSRWLFAKGRNAGVEVQAVPPKLAQRYMFHVKHSLTAADGNIIVCERSGD